MVMSVRFAFMMVSVLSGLLLACANKNGENGLH
jgi:hypothetical protein